MFSPGSFITVVKQSSGVIVRGRRWGRRCDVGSEECILECPSAMLIFRFINTLRSHKSNKFPYVEQVCSPHPPYAPRGRSLPFFPTLLLIPYSWLSSIFYVDSWCLDSMRRFQKLHEIHLNKASTSSSSWWALRCQTWSWPLCHNAFIYKHREIEYDSLDLSNSRTHLLCDRSSLTCVGGVFPIFITRVANIVYLLSRQHSSDVSKWLWV